MELHVTKRQKGSSSGYAHQVSIKLLGLLPSAVSFFRDGRSVNAQNHASITHEDQFGFVGACLRPGRLRCPTDERCGYFIHNGCQHCNHCHSDVHQHEGSRCRCNQLRQLALLFPGVRLQPFYWTVCFGHTPSRLLNSLSLLPCYWCIRHSLWERKHFYSVQHERPRASRCCSRVHRHRLNHRSRCCRQCEHRYCGLGHRPYGSWRQYGGPDWRPGHHQYCELEIWSSH
jgi:hypothetical protein